MKINKKVLLLLIELAVVAITLVVAITTYAWYTSQTRVTASETYVFTAASGSTEIVAETSPEYDTYSGQTGRNNGDDAPYYVTKEMTVTFTPTQSNSALQISFFSIVIEKTNGTIVNSSSNENVIPSFTWRLIYNETEYQPDENNFAYTMENSERSYIVFNSTTTISYVLKIIYLSDSDYTKYSSNDYENITGFTYSGYDYMRAKFTLTIEIGSDVLVV
ncbi:MAG: hypothetical protein K5765_04445 [Clostridia bacterium]|nr:hypothetical protein [Clostridia bacterium]